MKQTLLFFTALSLFGFNSWGQEAIDEFELETETSFFEAQNAEQQLQDAKDVLLKEQLETQAAQAEADSVSKQAKKMREKVQAERLELERQRVALAKVRKQYKKEVESKLAEIKKRNSELERDRTSLKLLAKEVRDLKRKNQTYQLRINAQKRSDRQLKEYAAEGNRLKRSQKRSLAQREKVLRTHRKPASFSQNDVLNVNLIPQKRR